MIKKNIKRAISIITRPRFLYAHYGVDLIEYYVECSKTAITEKVEDLMFCSTSKTEYKFNYQLVEKNKIGAWVKRDVHLSTNVPLKQLFFKYTP